jgi:hypothetical protein
LSATIAISWVQGNAQVIVVVSRRDTNEAYWVAVKDYFRDATSPPPSRPETLYSNLLEVRGMHTMLYVGQALTTSGHDFGRRAREAGVGIEWRHGGRQVVSVPDMATEEWRALVDRGTGERVPASEWADAVEERRRDLVELLNRCLGARARQLGLLRNRDEGYYYFPATADRSYIS